AYGGGRGDGTSLAPGGERSWPGGDARARRARPRSPGGRTDRDRLPGSALAAGMSAPPIRVLVVDDQTVVREGLEMLLGLSPGIEVVGGAADGIEAVRLVDELRPHVVLMDLRMPRLDGVEATRQIVRAHPETRIV